MKNQKTLSFLLIIMLIPQICFGMVGLKVGDNVPKVMLKDIDGMIVDLSNELKSTVLIFYRGSWCPYCVRQLISVQSDVMPKIKSNADIVAISVDSLKVSKKMKKKNKFSLRIVSDPKAKTLIAFNIVNKLDDKLVEKYKSSYKIDIEGVSGETHHMVAHPAVFIIKNGKVSYSDVHIDYKQRTKNKEILDNI